MTSRRWRAGWFCAAALVLLSLVSSVLLLANSAARTRPGHQRGPDAVVLGARPPLPVVCGKMNCSLGSVCCGNERASICCGWGATCCQGIDAPICCAPNATCCNGLCCLQNSICCNGICGQPNGHCTGTVVLAPPIGQPTTNETR
mmetsp:Transcript_55928/g.159199  ORF Transcript_55928/g.159199 Transcript_55928/m.159199 type:complete len:145 (-) Transcript_55928:65-499(-)